MAGQKTLASLSDRDVHYSNPTLNVLWQYAYTSPSDSGTYVWSVNRIEVLDGVQHYVVKTGTREIFYRVSDIAAEGPPLCRSAHG